MSEFKGTQGPWEFVVERGYDAYVIPQGSTEDAICRVNGDAKHIEIFSNARLIAAAPELLEALSALMEIETTGIGMDDFEDADSVGAYQDNDGSIKDLPLTFGHIRRARAAIAKATGQ